MSRTVTALFTSRDAAMRAADMLATELRIQRSDVRVTPGEGMLDTGYDKARPYEETGFFAALKDMFLPDEDRYAYAEGLRRGHILLSATVDEAHMNAASALLERAGAADLDHEEAGWKQTGWKGYDASAHKPAAPMAAAGRQDDTIKVVQERLVVGKRDVAGGNVRVRAYVVERPVEEQVTLHEERVQVERHPVDRAATAADLAAFQERTIEARATSEEAVIGKETRVVEEIGLRKESSDRTETVRDTVRETKVDVEDDARTSGKAGGSAGTTGTLGTVHTDTPHAGTPHTGTAHTGTAHTGTVGAAATDAGNAIDRTLNTNVSGTNPKADAPDGTPGNPSGTMASRAVDKTLGTNISGANPTRK